MAASDDRDRQTSEPQETEEPSPAPHAPEGQPAGQEALEASLRPLKSGEIVSGLVVHMDEHGALVDVGTKSEGLVPPQELRRAGDSESQVAVGDRIDVYVLRTESEDGHMVLSKKRADYEWVWRQVIEAHEKGEVMSAMVVDRVKGGLVVDLGLRGFLPASHVATRNVHALDRFVGQSLRLKIIEVDRARKRVVVSHRQAVQEERQQRREATLASLEEGEVRKGVVRRITDYGAFVDLGGVDGLLHVTEMAWTRVRHPSDVVKPGQKIDVMVLKFDHEAEKISLGLKQILPDPWQHVAEKYAVGEVVSGRVTRLVPFGAFVQLEDGIEGVIPTAELGQQRVSSPSDVLAEDQPVQTKIVAIRPGERRMTLSLRQVQQDKERREYQEYQQRQREASRVTLGDLVGDVLSQHPQATRSGDPEEPPSGRPRRAAAASGEPESQPSRDAPEEPGEPVADEDTACSSSDSPGESPAEKADSPSYSA
jgi:small subunit ribosomal protein S1